MDFSNDARNQDRRRSDDNSLSALEKVRVSIYEGLLDIERSLKGASYLEHGDRRTIPHGRRRIDKILGDKTSGPA